MLFLEEHFRRHIQAFASVVFTHTLLAALNFLLQAKSDFGFQNFTSLQQNVLKNVFFHCFPQSSSKKLHYVLYVFNTVFCACVV